jgi:CheY-like chemotaxis protein
MQAPLPPAVSGVQEPVRVRLPGATAQFEPIQAAALSDDPWQPCSRYANKRSYMPTTPHPVLVVEDDADIRDAMIGILEAEGYAVRGARHGAEALAELRAGSRPCIILLDLMMPVMDGWAFCQEREKDPALAAIPIVVVSAVAPHDARNACVRAVEHLAKPLDVAKLLAAVERYC